MERPGRPDIDSCGNVVPAMRASWIGMRAGADVAELNAESHHTIDRGLAGSRLARRRWVLSI
jgi:hypothetical protein